MKRQTRQRAAPPYPYPIRDRNQIDGEPWTLREPVLRALLAHCLRAPAFAEPDDAVDLFVTWADWELRNYRTKIARKAAKPTATLEQIAKHAAGLAAALDRLFLTMAREPHNGFADSPWDDLIGTARAIRSRARAEPVEQIETRDAVPSVFTLRATAQAARGLLQINKRTRGKRDPVPLWQRQLLIDSLWHRYPAPLRTLALRGHFLESLRLVMGRPASDAARKALKMDASRALAAVAKFRAIWESAPRT